MSDKAKQGAADGTGEVFKGRTIFHRWMGPAESCRRCYGRGWYPEADEDGFEIGERYCDCHCGDERRRVDGANGG